MAMLQQELKPQPTVTTAAPDDEDEFYEEEPRRRRWGRIASVLLALALVFVGYQWHQASGRADALASQVNALRAEAETQRLRGEDAQRQAEGLQKRVAAMSADRDALTERIAALEKAARDGSRERGAVAAKQTSGRTRATPVNAKKPLR